MVMNPSYQAHITASLPMGVHIRQHIITLWSLTRHIIYPFLCDLSYIQYFIPILFCMTFRTSNTFLCDLSYIQYLSHITISVPRPPERCMIDPGIVWWCCPSAYQTRPSYQPDRRGSYHWEYISEHYGH